ncbi:MAG TPA: Ig-like domain-containing protein [Gemmatimonadaceae bacterium]|jgi:hypothetical protein
MSPSIRTIAYRVVWLALSVVILACGGEHATLPSAPGKIAIRSGDAQRGSAGQRLHRPIVLVVHDALDAPVANVQVTWIAEDGGTIEPSESVTDANGLASAMWTLGDGPTHRGHAAAAGFLSAEFTASIDADTELPLDVIQLLDLTTYEGSGQTVHPDYVATGPEWTHAGKYVFITPYPNGNINYENPSIFEIDQPTQWLVPDGASNPIVAPTDGYYSDPDAVYVPERNEIWLYFRQVTDENIVRLTTTRDGVAWTSPVDVARAPNHELISPTVVRRSPNDWLMWSVNGNVGCTGVTTSVQLRRSPNGIDWSSPEPVALSQPGFTPWHIDVAWIESRAEYWALYNVKTAGSCATSAVYLATSNDGVTWTTYPSPVLTRGVIPELQDVVYRSSFAYDPSSDALTIWYSGARVDGKNYVWRSAVQRRLRTDLFATIMAPATASLPSVTVALPPLLNFP